MAQPLLDSIGSVPESSALHVQPASSLHVSVLNLLHARDTRPAENDRLWNERAAEWNAVLEQVIASS